MGIFSGWSAELKALDIVHEDGRRISLSPEELESYSIDPFGTAEKVIRSLESEKSNVS